MNPKIADMNNIEKKLLQKVKSNVREEYNKEIASLRQRDDFSSEFNYFLDVLASVLTPGEFRKKPGIPLAGLYCIQAPLELFDALGFRTVRLFSGSLAVQRLSSAFMPALACPVIKSCAAPFYQDDSMENICDILIMPTTCDWNVKLPGIVKDRGNSFYVMELPHSRESERGRKRWLEEIYELKRTLEKHTGKKLNRRRLSASIDKYNRAWHAFGQLIELRRERAVSGTWSIILANAFMIDDVESWTSKINTLFKSYSRLKKNNNPGIFLAGSPVFFPNLKISELIEDAGMFVAADELCTSERNLVNIAFHDESSEYGLLESLAERYQLPCSCPTYMDNDRRVNNILETMRAHNIKGVVYHILKGCHPYDIESICFEKAIKQNGFHFIRIETDYSGEDRQNISIRLEAFRETIC